MIKKILISQPQPSSEKSPYFDLAKRYDVELTFHSFVKVEGVSAKEFRSQKVHIPEFSAIIFNSRHAIDHFFNLCKELRITMPDETKYFGISEKVMLYIQKYVQYRKRKVFFSETGNWDELVTLMQKHNTERYLIPQGENTTHDLTQKLDSLGLDYKTCVIYRTISNKMPKSIKEFDLAILFTPIGVDTLVKTYPDFQKEGVKLGCFGHSTAQHIKDLGLPLALEAPTASTPSLSSALEKYLQQNKA
ncbi:MAG: uroporphyrinogen-III synthase [Alloprevotella sp.]|nr:uroporphyrinogen-III synthase [Alloprevotella sp.]